MTLEDIRTFDKTRKESFLTVAEAIEEMIVSGVKRFDKHGQELSYRKTKDTLRKLIHAALKRKAKRPELSLKGERLHPDDTLSEWMIDKADLERRIKVEIDMQSPRQQRRVKRGLRELKKAEQDMMNRIESR